MTPYCYERVVSMQIPRFPGTAVNFFAYLLTVFTAVEITPTLFAQTMRKTCWIFKAPYSIKRWNTNCAIGFRHSLGGAYLSYWKWATQSFKGPLSPLYRPLCKCPETLGPNNLFYCSRKLDYICILIRLFSPLMDVLNALVQ